MKLSFYSRKTRTENVFDTLNVLVMIIICFLTLYPVWFTLVNSFNQGTDALRGGIYWWPRIFSVENYTAVFQNHGIVTAMLVTAAKTIIGTVVHVFFTAMVAYALSKSELIGRKLFMMIGLITMFFNGGLIPTYLLIKNLGMLDHFIVYIIPAAFSFFDLLIFVSFFRNIPQGLEEAAKIDGAGDFRIFLKVVIPISMPVVATIALFHGVWQWNDYFTGMIYTNNESLQPIQTFLYRVISQSASSQMMDNMPGGIINRTTTPDSIKYATMVVTTLPIVCVYPFLQKYFVKGMLLGSMKG